MSEALTALKTGASLLRFLKAWADPGKRRALEEAITDHVLNEIPRVTMLLQERISDVAASGCTPEEAQIIAYQVIEAQKRTCDEDKRRRLTNVLVNGLCSKRWDKATHRLMVRLASEMEEEHVARLKAHIGPFKSYAEQLQEEALEDARWPNETEREKFSRRVDRDELIYALDRELLAVGLLEEIKSVKAFAQPVARGGSRGRQTVYAEEDITTKTRITSLGRRFLAHLRDPHPSNDTDRDDSSSD